MYGHQQKFGNIDTNKEKVARVLPISLSFLEQCSINMYVLLSMKKKLKTNVISVVKIYFYFVIK